MAQLKLAVQLYTLRDFLKTPADIAQTFKKIKQIGYNAVELASLGNIDVNELAGLLSDIGLSCCGGHVALEKMQKDSQRVIDDHLLLKCPHLAVPGYWGKTLPDFEKFAADYNALAPRFDKAGLPLGYHNHSHELVKHNRRTPLSLLVEKLARPIGFEFDTYWLVHGGADPIQWINLCASRIPCIHLKDMVIDEQGVQHMAEVGEGNLNWPAILAACLNSGVQWLVVEQDVCPRDPFDCLASSLRNLRRMGDFD